MEREGGTVCLFILLGEEGFSGMVFGYRVGQKFEI